MRPPSVAFVMKVRSVRCSFVALGALCCAARPDTSVNTLNPATRKAAMDALQLLLADELPTLPLYFRPNVTAASNRIVNLKPDDGAVSGACTKLYDTLQAKGVTVLHDDRDLRPGAKFADMDLIGTPWQVIVGPKGLAAGKLEVKNRKTGAREELPADQVVARFG